MGIGRDLDGRAPALEAQADLPSRTPGDEGDAGRRRDRAFSLPQDLLDHSLGQKVLDGWLQNRHQILVPLTFRLARLAPDDLTVLMRFAAIARLSVQAGDDVSRQGLERWLREVDAGDAGLVAFRTALGAPQPLSVLLDEISGRHLNPYAYAIAVKATDTRDPAGHLFANYVAARLALPADAIRSIDRRFRR